MPTSPTPISGAPTVPDRADRATFPTRMYDMFVYLVGGFISGVNVIADNVYDNAVEAEADAAAADADAAAAAASAAAAAATTGVIAWVSGTTYAVGDCRFSPVDYLTYRRTTAGAGTTDPSLDLTNWRLAIPGPTRVVPYAGGTLSDGMNIVISSGAITAPSLIGAVNFSVAAASSAAAVPAAITMSDGWSVAPAFVAGTTEIIAPIDVSTAHGLWTEAMTPPMLATITGSANHVILGTALIDTDLYAVLFRDPTGSTGNVYAVAVNTSTNAVGAVATVGAWSSTTNGALACIYADSTTSFVCGFLNNAAPGGNYKVWAGSINTGTLAITFGTGVQTLASNTDANHAAIKLANGLYAISHDTTTELVAFTVAGTVVTMGAAVASGALSNGARIVRASDSTFLAVYNTTGGGAGATRGLSARVCSVAGTVITPNTASAAATNVCADDLRLAKAFAEGTSYIACAKDGSTATTGNYYGISVSGTTATVGAISAQTTNLVAAGHTDTTYVHKRAETPTLYNSSTMLFGHLAAGPFAITISGTTLTVGTSGGPATTTSFLRDTATGAITYAVGSAAFDKISVSGTTVTSAWQVAVAPLIVQSDTLTDKAVKYGSTWFTWSLPTMQVALKDTKWLYRSSNNLLYCGPMS